MNRIDVDTAHRIWNTWITEHRHQAELLNPCDLIRMVEDELEKRRCRCRVFVRDLYIANGIDCDKVWIGETDGGEAGEFAKDKFYEVLREFYDKEF